MSGSANQHFLDMHTKINEKVNEQAQKVKITVAAKGDFLQKQTEDKIALTTAVDVPIPTDEFLQFTEEIASIIIEFQPQLESTIEAIMKMLKTTDVLEEFIKASKHLDLDYFVEFGEKNNLNGAISQFLGEMTYRSYAKAFASIVNTSIDIADYRSKQCPVCGEVVRIIRDAEDGKREACCTRCDTVWKLAMSECPHCNNNDQEKLRFITSGSEEKRKVYACEECKGYVKFVDMQEQIGKPSFFLVDLETIYLDMVAAQQGFGADMEEKETRT